MSFSLNTTNIIREWHFQFEEVKVPAYSTAGTRYYRSVRIGMPTVHPSVLGNVFFLYPTVDDARRGTKVGGTGFFFSVEPGDIPGHYYYAVTNWHNIFDGTGAPIIRLNTKSGEPDIFELSHDDWIYKPGWHDLAIAEITLDFEKHDVTFATSKWIAAPAELPDFGLGLGSDIFMIGRFMEHDGDTVNVPAIRLFVGGNDAAALNVLSDDWTHG